MDHVLGIGNAIVDVISATDDDFLDDLHLVKGSMRLIDEEIAADLYDRMSPGTEVSGGSAANTMAGIASLGGRARFVGKVRDDDLGQVFARDLRAAGVAFDTPPATSGPATARSLILVTPDAQRTMNTFLGVSQDLSAADVVDQAVSDAEVTYLEGYLWDPPEAKKAFQHAMAVAGASGRKVALTLSDSFCVERYRDEFMDLIRDGVDIVFANENELATLHGSPDLDAALREVSSHCSVVALTRGSAGSILCAGDESIEIPAAPVDKVIDTTGAGDLYAAGVLYGLAQDLPLETCGRLGSLCAAEVISHVGARPITSLALLAKDSGLLG